MTAPAPAPTPDDALTRDVWLVAGVVVLGAIMSILDVTVVNVAINTLAREFETELTTIQWVATGYTLALATVIPLTGWAADRFGTKRLYVTSIVLFVGGSVLCGLAWSAGSLIAFRVLQGFGGGMLMPLGMTIMTRRIGLIRPETSVIEAHDRFLAFVPEERMYEAHVNLITHGRRTCHARRPACERCPVAARCRWFHPTAP